MIYTSDRPKPDQSGCAYSMCQTEQDVLRMKSDMEIKILPIIVATVGLAATQASQFKMAWVDSQGFNHVSHLRLNQQYAPSRHPRRHTKRPSTIPCVCLCHLEIFSDRKLWLEQVKSNKK
jgi:hypothetical protein